MLEIFAELPGGNQLAPVNFNFFYFSLLSFLNLVLIPSGLSDAHRDTCTECFRGKKVVYTLVWKKLLSCWKYTK